MKVAFLLWAPFGFRAAELSEVVEAQIESITVLYGPRYFAPIRYLALFFRTLILLSRIRPQVVYSQNPPVFCPLTCLLFCRLSGARLVIDHHSIWSIKTIGGRSPLAKAIAFLERFVSRSSYANTAPHSLWARTLSKMGARNVLVYHDYVPKNHHHSDERLRLRMAQGSILAIASHGGHPLERMEVEAAAVAKERNAGVSLVISGPREKLQRRLAQIGLPPNVSYVGFLDRDVYETLKASADLAVNITDEPFTLSHVLFEFAASSLPVISSRQEVVEEVFSDSLLYCDSTVEDVNAKVKELIPAPARAEWAAKIRRKQDQLTKMHEQEVSALRRLLAQ